MNLHSLLQSEGLDPDALPFESEPAPSGRFEFEPLPAGTRLRAPSDFDKVFADAGAAFDVDPVILKSIAFAESGFDPDIISGKKRSRAGAIGLMQFMPDTAKEYDNLDPTNPVQSIFAAAQYMRKSLDKFGGDYGKAVASYNHGPNSDTYNREDWDQRVPPETQRYLFTVFDAAGRFKDGQAERGLPQGVAPSKAGAGRGSVSPGMLNTQETQVVAQPAVPVDTMEARLKKQGEFSPLEETGKGLQSGYTGLKQMWEANKVLKDSVLANSMAQRLSAFDRIDAGATDVPRAIGLAYQQADAAGRAKIRADVQGELAGRKDFIGASMETIRQYQAEQQRTKGRTTDLTDVGNLKDFGNWLAFNGASGVVSMAPLMVAAVATGPAAPFVTGALGYGMATGELAGDRINSAQGKLSPQRFSRNPDRYDDALRAENQNVTDYVANTAGSTVGAAIPFAALDVVAGPVGSLLKGAGKEIAQKGVKYAAKEIGKDTLEETATGGLQEVIKIATENALGEQDGILTGENLKRVINSAAAEGAGGMVGGAGRVSYQAVTRPAPTVESQPTTPQAPAVAPGAPVTQDAAKTQAVDNIAAAILEAEGGTTQATSVQPSSQAVDAGTATVDAGQQGAEAGSAGVGAVDGAGQSESAQSLSQIRQKQEQVRAAMQGAVSPLPTDIDTVRLKQEFARMHATAKGGFDPMADVNLQTGANTTGEDVKRLVTQARQEVDAKETAEIQRMLSEDAAAKQEMADATRATAEGVRSDSDRETQQSAAEGLAQRARTRLVDSLVASYAEPTGYFASPLLKAVTSQLAVLQQPALTKQEQSRITDLVTRAQAFVAPNLPSDKASTFPDTGANNASMESLIKEKQPKKADNERDADAELAARTLNEGGATQATSVQPSSQAVDAGTATVDAGQQGATGGLAGPGAVDVAGQSESAGALTMFGVPHQVGGKDPHTVTYSHRDDDGRITRVVEYPDGERAEHTLMTDRNGDEQWVSWDQYAKGEWYPVQTQAQFADQVVSDDLGSKDGYVPPVAKREAKQTGALTVPEKGSEQNLSTESTPAPTGIAAEMAALKARANTPRQNKAPKPLLTDGERAMLGDFERLYQADVKGEIKTRLGLMPARQDEATAPAEKRKPSELLAAIKNAGGIKSTNAGDLMGGNAAEANRILPGLFTKGGMNMDLLVPFLRDRGYLTQADEDSINDNGGVNKLAEILQAELSGDRAQTVDSTTGFEADADNAMRSQLDEKAFALGLPMKVTNEMSTERLNGVINRIERKLGRPVNTDFATRKMTRTEAMAERQAILMADRVERARAQYDADIQAFAEADDAVQDAALDVFIDENGDVVIVNERDADAELAARTLNGSWSDQNGQETATTQDSRTGTDAREVGAPVARGSDQGTQADQGNGTEAGAGQEGLTSYTPSEVTARQDATAQAEATAKRAEEAAARAEAAAKQASEIAQRSVAAADTFELGGNAEDNLSGQQGLKFSKRGGGQFSDIARHFSQYPSRPPAGMPLDEARAFLKARRESMDALVAKYAPKAEGLMLPVQNGGFWGVTKEARPDGDEWRVTRFDKDMEPQGHEAHRSAETAVADLMASVDPARLDQGLMFSKATDKPSTPASTIRQAITKAYGNLLPRLEGKGLVSLTQTEEEAIAAAAQARADQNGGVVEAIKAQLLASVLASQRAWHGTPHRGIEKFSTDYIGTGEGAQAFGWGLYFADRRELGEYYKDTLKGRASIKQRGPNDYFVTDPKGEVIADGVLLGQAHKAKEAYDAKAGQLYEVEIPEDSEMLLWDKPLSEQPENVLAALLRGYEEQGGDYPDKSATPKTGREIYNDFRALAGGFESMDQRAASEYLASLGIKGIKYLDGTSRNAGDGSFNYVVFDGADTQIVDVKYSANGNIEGFFDKQTGKSFLIADNLTAESAPATLMHEVGIHMAADGKLEPLFTRAGNLLKLARDNAFIQRVQSRMDEAGETSNEEAAAYIVTEYEKDRTNAPASVGKWIKDFIADVRAWLFNKGVLLKADQLTVADIAAVARANANRIAQSNGWVGSAQKEGAFRFGNTEGQRSEDVATVAEAFSGEGIQLEGFSNFDGAQTGVRLKDAPTYTMEFKVQPGDGPLIVDATRANGETGQSPGGNAGQRMYQALFAWAHNNGKRVDADYSLSYVNELRRTSAMLSSALRFGTIDHFGELNEQQGVDGWDAADFDASVKALANAELRKVEQRVPVFSSLEIDPATGDVYSRVGSVLESEGQGLGYGAPLDGRLGTDQQGAGSNRNLADLERRLAARQKNTRRSDGREQDAVGAQTRNTDTVGNGTSVQGNRLSDSELARYLASTRGGFEAHGVGVSTLKRALITRDFAGETDLPGLLYSVAGDPGIRRSVRNGGQGQLFQQQPVTTWDDLGDSKMDRLIYEGQDDRIDLKRVQENIVQSGRAIRDEFDARMAETLFPGRVAKRNESFVDHEVKPLLQAMSASNVSMEELGDYLLARHAPERNAQVAKVNPGMQDGGAGTNSQGVLMTTQAAQDHIANLSAGKRTALQLLARRVDEITKGTREMLVTEGLEKASTVAAWEGAYKNYVPLFKDEAAETPGHPVGSGFSVKGGASKRAMGSTKEVTNVLAHVLMQREAAITRTEKNRVAMSLYGLALSNPNKEFWSTVVPNMSTPEILAELQNMGVNVADAFAGMEATPTIRYVDPSTGLVTERPNPVYKNLDNALVVKVNGEDRVILFNKQNARAMRLAESLKNQNRGSGVFVDGANLVAPVTRFMASMLTQYNPAFGMVNAVRDIQGALVNLSSTDLKGQQAKVLAGVPAAMKGIARDLRGDKARTQWSDLWLQFQDDGGRTGIRDLVSDPYEKAGQIEKDLKRLESAGKLTPGNAAHAVLDLLSDFNDTLENGVRLSAYKTALDQGMSRPAAAKLARELTVDFNRKGRTGRELGKLYAFLNASIQGSARTIQSLKGPMGAKIMAGGFALGVLQAFMLAWAGFDDEDIPEFIKSRNLIIPMGGDRYVTIPMALGLHVLPNAGRVVTELVMSGGKDLGDKSLSAITEIVTSFNPFGGGGDWKSAHGPLTMVTPTVMDPVIDMAMNRDFAGRTISKERRNPGDVRPGATMAREGTKKSPSGQVYIGVSELINTVTGGTDVTKGAWSPTPEELRYMATVVGGGVYRETERAINAAVLLARGDEVKPHQVPLGSRFAGTVDAEMSTMGRYYKNDEALNKFWSEFKAEAKDGNTERVAEMRKDPRYTAAAMNSKIEQHISKLNKLAGENVGDQAKYEELNQKRAELMRKVNDAVKEAEAK